MDRIARTLLRTTYVPRDLVQDHFCYDVLYFVRTAVVVKGYHTQFFVLEVVLKWTTYNSV